MAMVECRCSSVVWLLSFTLVAPTLVSAQQTTSKPDNARPQTLAGFVERVNAYAKLRDTLAKETPLKETADRAEIARAEKGLAQRIRVARVSAKPGDLFTPEIQAELRRLLKPPLKGPEGRENTQAIKDDAPAPVKVPFVINADYPSSLPLSTVPPDVLASLPALPKDLNYRFAGQHLILHDARANIIVDFMLNAIPS